jgi:HicB family
MSPRRRVPAKSYSGKFLLRIPPALHKALDAQALREGVSLNSLVTRFLQERMLTGQDSTIEALKFVREGISQLLPLMNREVNQFMRKGTLSDSKMKPGHPAR